MAVHEARPYVSERLVPALLDAGFTQRGRRQLWLRRADGLVHVVGASPTAPGSRGQLSWGVWIPDLADLMAGTQTEPLREVTECHLRWDAQEAEPAPDQLVGALDQLRTLHDVAVALESEDGRAWPRSSGVCELYLAGLAVLTGSPTAFDRAEAAAFHLQGTGRWSVAANHVYRSVATLE